MRPGTATRARRILLLCALALAVLGMHHVALPPHGTVHPAMASEHMTTAQPADDGETGMEHDLLHLCLVVLCAAATFLLATWLPAATSTPGPGALRRPPVPRAPKAAGRAILTAVCVLRL